MKPLARLGILAYTAATLTMDSGFGSTASEFLSDSYAERFNTLLNSGYKKQMVTTRNFEEYEELAKQVKDIIYGEHLAWYKRLRDYRDEKDKTVFHQKRTENYQTSHKNLVEKLRALLMAQEKFMDKDFYHFAIHTSDLNKQMYVLHELLKHSHYNFDYVAEQRRVLGGVIRIPKVSMTSKIGLWTLTDEGEYYNIFHKFSPSFAKKFLAPITLDTVEQVGTGLETFTTRNNFPKGLTDSDDKIEINTSVIFSSIPSFASEAFRRQAVDSTIRHEYFHHIMRNARKKLYERIHDIDDPSLSVRAISQEEYLIRLVQAHESKDPYVELLEALFFTGLLPTEVRPEQVLSNSKDWVKSDYYLSRLFQDYVFPLIKHIEFEPELKGSHDKLVNFYLSKDSEVNDDVTTGYYILYLMFAKGVKGDIKAFRNRQRLIRFFVQWSRWSSQQVEEGKATQSEIMRQSYEMMTKKSGGKQSALEELEVIDPLGAKTAKKDLALFKKVYGSMFSNINDMHELLYETLKKLVPETKMKSLSEELIKKEMEFYEDLFPEGLREEERAFTEYKKRGVTVGEE